MARINGFCEFHGEVHLFSTNLTTLLWGFIFPTEIT